MNQRVNLKSNKGSSLIVVILVLLVVTVIGILATRTATIELQVASHDKLHKTTWYATEAVCDGLMPELIERNIEDRGFGDQTTPFNYGPTQNLWIHKTDFWVNDVPVGVDVEMGGLSQTDVNVCLFCTVGPLPGSGDNMIEGYSGRGKTSAKGGSQRIYTISGLGRGPANSESRVLTGWRHVF
jgi:hypothetical protein